ncbi:hypothetical protein B0J15DRAFT_486250, partial [Fusarium solani]
MSHQTLRYPLALLFFYVISSYSWYCGAVAYSCDMLPVSNCRLTHLLFVKIILILISLANVTIIRGVAVALTLCVNSVGPRRSESTWTFPGPNTDSFFNRPHYYLPSLTKLNSRRGR